MTLFEFCQKLLPGDKNFNIEPFSKELLKKILDKEPEKFQLLKQGLSTLKSSSNNDEVYNFINYLKMDERDLYYKFRDELLSVYLSDPDILRKLGSSEVPLFPGNKPLPLINYDLLEVVYERGEIWRKVKNIKNK